MSNTYIDSLDRALSPIGFRRIQVPKVNSDFIALFKLQTLNINRAVAVLELERLPGDLRPLVKRVKKEAAFRCGFFPFFYGLGIQLVIVVSEGPPITTDLREYVDKIDNQWSIVQSIFVVHASCGLVCSARTWGQFVTKKYQDLIEATFSKHDTNTA